MQTIKEYIPRIRRWFLRGGISFLIIFIIINYGINSWLSTGITPVPTGAVYLKNFDNLDKIKTWSELKQEYQWLDTETAIARPIHLSMNVYFNSWLQELKYPKSVTAIYVTVESRSSSDTLQTPSILVIIIDQNERIRGKLYTSYRTRDYSLKETAAEYVFWFEFPDDMRESRYSVIVELFGEYGWEEERRAISEKMEERYDDIYGQIPYVWDNFILLEYYREDNKVAPPPTTIHWSIALAASGLISGAIFRFLVKFSKELWNYHLQHRELLLYEGLCVLTLGLFIIFVFLITSHFLRT